MLGAQQVANRALDAARANFAQAATLARQAGAEGEALLSDGYVALTDLLAAPDDAAARAQFDAVKTVLVPLEHGDFFGNQLDTALCVFATH